MTATEYLNQYRDAQYRADRLKERLDQARSEYDAVKGGIVFKSYRNDISKPTERKAEKAKNAFDRWYEAQLDAVEIRQEIFEVINNLNDCRLSDILWYRYLGLLEWEKVCEAVGLSWCHVHKIHKNGLGLVKQAMIERKIL